MFEELGRTEDQECGGAVAELERTDTGEKAAQRSGEYRADLKPEPSLHVRRGSWGVADGVEHGECREETGDDRQAAGPAGADRGDEADRGEGADDRAEAVHGALEAVGTAVGSGGDDVGQECIAGGYADTAGGPRAGPQDGNLPGGGDGRDRRRQHGGSRVAADGQVATSFGFVGQRAAAEAGDAGERIAHALDEAKCRRWCAEGRGQ